VASPLRERIRGRAQQLADEQGARIEFIGRAHIRKEDVVAKVLAARGEHPGLVHVIAAMEACESYKPWHDKPSGKSDSALSRQLQRLRALGLIKRVSRSYRYYLTRLGRAAIAAACSLTQFQIVPALACSR
jgi:DNA-binding transcriptional ArsR family regulator